MSWCLRILCQCVIASHEISELAKFARPREGLAIVGFEPITDYNHRIDEQALHHQPGAI